MNFFVQNVSFTSFLWLWIFFNIETKSSFSCCNSLLQTDDCTDTSSTALNNADTEIWWFPFRGIHFALTLKVFWLQSYASISKHLRAPSWKLPLLWRVSLTVVVALIDHCCCSDELNGCWHAGSKEGGAVLTQSPLNSASQAAWLQELHDLAVSLAQSGSTPTAAQRESEVLSQSFGVPTVESISNLEGAMAKWAMRWATALIPHVSVTPGTKVCTCCMQHVGAEQHAHPVPLVGHLVVQTRHDLKRNMDSRLMFVHICLIYSVHQDASCARTI